jgi:hypothetical protein
MMATVPGAVGREAKKARAPLYSRQSWLSVKGAVHEDDMFPPDAVLPGERAGFLWLVRGGVPHDTIFLMAGPQVKRIRGKKQPLSAAGLHALRDEYTRTIAPACALAAETLTLERTLSDLVNQAYALTPAEIALASVANRPTPHAPPAAFPSTGMPEWS